MNKRIDIDFERFCLMENIRIAKPGERHYRESWVSLPCPFCMGEDGNHLGYSKETKVFSCWRCGRHTIGDVLGKLLDKPKRDAVRYALDAYSADPFAPTYQAKQTEHVAELQLPGSKTPSKIHTDYLTKRGYDVDVLMDRWDVRFTLEHESHGNRIIFPVWHDGKFVSYVGRDVTGQHNNKYLTCYPENEVISIKKCVWGLQHACADTVIIVEGIFDALRVGEGVVAVLGTGYTQSQASLLAKRFKKSYILFDNEHDAQHRARALAETLCLTTNHTSKVLAITDKSINDPSELPETAIKQLRGLLCQ